MKGKSHEVKSRQSFLLSVFRFKLMKYKLKICGMKYSGNIKEVASLVPDYMGFIFYDKSKRFVEDELDKDQLLLLNDKIEKVGVFVNEEKEGILDKAKTFGFRVVQLHGDESPLLCRQLKEKGLTVIKAFSIGEKFDFEFVKPYKRNCDFFLFDTKGANYGGSGVKFNWDILKEYDNEIPFFLSGGIDIINAEEIKNLKGLNIHAIDINSCFETAPGMKDSKKISQFISKI
jgi:phosphoribosylanthranilate isomerase